MRSLNMLSTQTSTMKSLTRAVKSLPMLVALIYFELVIHPSALRDKVVYSISTFRIRACIRLNVSGVTLISTKVTYFQQSGLSTSRKVFPKTMYLRAVAHIMVFGQFWYTPSDNIRIFFIKAGH